MASFYDQQKFWYFNDNGSESTATIRTPFQNTNAVVDVSLGNVDLTLRIAVANTGSGPVLPVNWTLQYNKNSAGWVSVTGGTSNVHGYSSANLTDQGATTNRLSGASGTFGAGKIGEAGAANTVQVSAGNNTEFLYTLRFVAADLSDSDVIQFRIVSTGSLVLDAYTVMPAATISKLGSTKFSWWAWSRYHNPGAIHV